MKSTDFSDRPRRGRIAAAAADAGLVAGSVFAGKGFSDPRLALDWKAIVGEDIAKLTLPMRLSSGTLTLKTEPGAAAFLALETEKICARINAYLGRPLINRLKFVQGPLQFRPEPPIRRMPPAALPPDDPALRFRGGDNLREALVKLARARRRWAIVPTDPPE